MKTVKFAKRLAMCIIVSVTGCGIQMFPQQFEISVPDDFRGPIAILPGSDSAKSSSGEKTFSIRVPQSGIVISPYREVCPEYYQTTVKTESGKLIPPAAETGAPDKVVFHGGSIATINSSQLFYNAFIGTRVEYEQFDRMTWLKEVSDILNGKSP